MKTWFTSDYHLGHANIIKYCERPFKDLYHMNSTIIRNHNERIKPGDSVFFLGDFCFRNTKGEKDGEGELSTADFYIQQLNGDFVFIKGNHDNNNSLKTKILGVVIEIDNKQIYLVHKPDDYNPAYPINFVGHVHELWKFKKLKDGTHLINIGCDQWNFMPISYNEIMTEYTKWKKNNTD